MLPVPSSPNVSTAYLKQGPHWSGGVHKGVDYAASAGTKVFAPWSGRVVGIGTWGSAFGNRSPVIDFDPLPDGSPGLWGVVAHLEKCAVRVGDRVEPGQLVGRAGRRGNATGPHLHFEVHRAASWSRGGHTDPAPHVRARPGGTAGAAALAAAGTAGAGLFNGGRVHSSKMSGPDADGRPTVTDSDSVRNLQIGLNRDDPDLGLPITGTYGPVTKRVVRAFQRKQGWSGADADGIAGRGTVTRLGLVWVDDGRPRPTFDRSTCDLVQRAVAASGVVADLRPRWDDPAIRGRGAFDPRFVILHHTGGTDSLRSLELEGDAPPVPGANFLVDTDGRVHVISGFLTHHAGKGNAIPGAARDAMNDVSFGIEVESLGRVKDFTEAQVDSVVALSRALLDEMGTGVDHLMNHRTWSRTGKPDTLYDDSFWRVRVLQRSVADAERTLGPDDPESLVARTDLAEELLLEGRLDEAIPLLETAVADASRILGPEHAQTLVLRGELAGTLQSAHREAEAIPLLEQNVRDGDRVLGVEHPDVLANRNDLALALEAVGRVEDAVPLLSSAVTVGDAALGHDFPFVGVLRANLARTTAALGRVGPG